MDRKWTCLNCEEEFRSGAWLGCRGNQTRKHKAELRTFYSDSDRLQVNAIPDRRIMGSAGESIAIAGAIVTFNGGQFPTDDPELQEILAERCPMTREQYIEIRESEKVKTERLRTKVQEQQALIEELKAKVAAQNSASTSKAEESSLEPVGATSARRSARR